MKKYVYTKIDTILVCEIEKMKEIVYQTNFYAIHDRVNENIKDDIVLLFLVEKDGEVEDLIEKTLTVQEKLLILSKKVSNLELFDFLFFNYILENEENKNVFQQNTLEEIENVYTQFIYSLNTYRYDTIKHQTFHIKQRRISRKQLDAMKMGFKKWYTIAEFMDNNEEEE
jgi:hypothetical protein